jgi:hypothetical protein
VVPRKDKRFTDEAWQEELQYIRREELRDLPPTRTDCEAWMRWDHARAALRQQPFRGVSDTEMRMIADLRSEHGLEFLPTPKDDRDAAINGLRLRFQERKVLIHPRCSVLRAHLDHAIWKPNRTDFAQSDADGHFDALAALVYLNRNVDRQRNPNPPPEHGLSREDYMVLQTTQSSSNIAQALNQAIIGPARREKARRNRGGR